MLRTRRVRNTTVRSSWIGNFEINATMGSRGIVVIDEPDEDPLELAFVADVDPVQTLGPHRANESLGTRSLAVRSEVSAFLRIARDHYGYPYLLPGLVADCNYCGIQA